MRDPNAFDFGMALSILRAGGRVARLGWNGRGMWLALQRPDHHSKMSLPYIYMSTAQGDLVPWLASQTDVLASDWHSLPDEKPAAVTAGPPGDVGVLEDAMSQTEYRPLGSE